nr:15474_t:CDS:2 [Entrophospora candida]
MSKESRPHLIIDKNTAPFTPPPNIHPALAETNIKYWSYQHFVLQVILLKIPVNSVGDVEQAWIDSLKSLAPRKDMDKKYRCFIKKLIDYQTFEKLDSGTEFVLKLSNAIQWKPVPPPPNIQEYFNSNCSTNLSNENKKFNANIQYIIANIDVFKRSVTEEVLKMTTMGEIQSYSTKEAQNEDANPFQKARIGRKVDMVGNLKETSFKVEALFGEVSGGLGPFGLPAATRKNHFFDKIKLSIMLRDSLNSVIKKWRNLNDDLRKSVVLYGWTQHGLEINVYALKWEGNGIYLFGLVDKGTLPSSKNECGLFEDLYCIFKELERKLKKTEENIKNLNLLNVRSKRRNLGVESTPELNLNRTPN